MAYLAVEQKIKKDGTYEVSTFKKDTRDEVEKAYHSILASAAMSEHPIHSASILNPEGYVLRNECYKHPVEPEPEPEEEPKEEGEE